MNDSDRLSSPHLKRLSSFYDAVPELSWASRSYRKILAHYYNLLIPSAARVLEVGCGDGSLLSLLNVKERVGVDLSEKQVERAQKKVPSGRFYVQAGEELVLDESFDIIIVSDTVNLAADVQELLTRLQAVADPKTRIILNFHNTLWRPILGLATRLGLRQKGPENNWLAGSDVRNLLDLAGWEMIKTSSQILCPVKCLGLDILLNRFLAPLFPWGCLTLFYIARPRADRTMKPLTTSVLIPARNEAGNIEEIIQRTPELGPNMELIFVEGNSTDNTWEEIQRVEAAYPDKKIITMQQPGKGKGDAVRAGYAVATGDILMILDADMTMPPEELPKFYEILATNSAEFANGVRLVYPMEDEAMRFFNLCANKTFSLLFSWLLGQSIKDTLCGTKVMLRTDYEKLAANRSYFGDFDPFGDFDLIFGANKMNLKFADVPIRYAARTYGTTNIARWRNGVLLLRMVLFAARKLKFV
jgi:SAM-dependent methyltransferase